MRSGFIRLYFDGEFITALKFTSIQKRKDLMKSLNKRYRLNRQKKIVYYQLTTK